MNFPDKESIMNQVHDLAEEARERGATVGGVGEAPASPGVAAPIFLSKSHEIIPDRYVVHFSITHCKNCGTQSSSNQSYALSHIRSRQTGNRVRHLIPCDTPLFNLPVDRIATGVRTLPFCCECETIDLSHLPPPPIASQLYDLEEPRLKGQKPRPTAEAKKPVTPTKASLDDLA